MFVWTCALLFWISFGGGAITLIGMAVTSAACVTAFIYIDNLEKKASPPPKKPVL